MNSHKGFTLIELVVVIVILGILAGTALPKYVSLKEDAEIAVSKSYAAVLQQEVKFVYLRWVLNGHSKEVIDLQGYSDDTLDINTNGYPIGTTKNSPMSAPFNIGSGGSLACDVLWSYLIEDAPSVSYNEDNKEYRSYRKRGVNGNRSLCIYVLRKLGDTGDDETGKVRIMYESYTGEVSFVTQ